MQRFLRIIPAVFICLFSPAALLASDWVTLLSPRPVPGHEGNAVQVERLILVTMESETEGTKGIDENGAISFDGVGLLTITAKTPDGSIDDIRPIGLDSAGKPVGLSCGGGSWHPNGSYYIYYPSARNADGNTVEAPSVEIARIGLLRPSSDAAQRKAQAAAGRLKDSFDTVLTFPRIGKSFPFRLVSDNGEITDLSQLQGKVVVMDWWATWCSPCMSKMPWLMGLSDKLKDENVVFASVNFDASTDTLARKRAFNGLVRMRSQSDPVLGILNKLGVSMETPDLKGAVLDALARNGVKIEDTRERETAINTLKTLGFNIEATPDDKLARLGLPWKLTVVPQKQIPLYYDTVGENALPQMFVIGPDGVLRWYGHPGSDYSQREIENTITELLKTPSRSTG